MSILNELEIEQLYLARYDPLLQLSSDDFRITSEKKEAFSDTYSVIRPRSEIGHSDIHPTSKISLTSWRSQKLQTKLYGRNYEGRNLFDRVTSSRLRIPKGLQNDQCVLNVNQSFLINEQQYVEQNQFNSSSDFQDRNNSHRRSVKDAVSVWPPHKTASSLTERTTGSLTSRTSSKSGYVRNVLKKFHRNSTPTTPTIKSKEGRSHQKQAPDVVTSPSLLKIATHNYSSSKPSPTYNSQHIPEPPSSNEQALPRKSADEMNVGEKIQIQLPASDNSPKDPRRFMKGIGPSSPVGLLALVTRELSQTIHPLKFLKSANKREDKKLSPKQTSQQPQNTDNAIDLTKQKTKVSKIPSIILTSSDDTKKEISSISSETDSEATLLKSCQNCEHNASYSQESLKRPPSLESANDSCISEDVIPTVGHSFKDCQTQTVESSINSCSKDQNNSTTGQRKEEKFWTFTTSVVIPKNKLSGIPDHLERDSLDGNLPGSSHGTSTGNPPPPPAPPNASGLHGNPNNNNNNNNNESMGDIVNSHPDGTDIVPSGFSKGPNAKSKKHKRLKNDSGTLDFPNRDKDCKKRPSYDGPCSRDIESGGYRSKTEPYTYLWVVLSRMYGKLIVLLMLAFCLTEVLDNAVSPLTFQEVFILYLYVGSIIAIMCIYVTVIIDNCPSITASKENLTKPRDPESSSITSFGTLKRAHISRSKTSRTSFYLRVGALVFGLGTLIYNGLEIAMHSSIPEGCLSDTILAHPIMQALFTFLQMHFLFVNSEVVVEKFGQIARFGFMHLVATNLALWVRMVVWESANDSIMTMGAKEIVATSSGPKALGFHTMELQRLGKCYQNNTLGKLWLDSQQYLFPFLVQYSLIAASVTYIMWCNVGKERLHKLNRHGKIMSGDLDKRNKGHWKVDCRSASKGLFMGLLVLVGGIVILIIFFVMKDQVDFKPDLFWMINGTMMIIFSLSIIATIFGFIQIPKLSISSTQPLDLDRLLLSLTVIGVYIFAIFSMIVGGVDYNNSEKLASFCSNLLLLIQVSLQGMLIAEASRRTCTNRFQMLTKPGRQVITFLLFSNITLWILDTFMTHNSIAHQFQIDFYGKVVWGVIARVSLPLMILFRFHSAVILVEIWKNTYRTKAD